MLAYPLVGLVVGWLMIPFIMRLKVTSAYEILELRLGPAVRTLGSLLFLSLRLLWMSVIVYATTSKVLVPLLGLDPRTHAAGLCDAGVCDDRLHGDGRTAGGGHHRRDPKRDPLRRGHRDGDDHHGLPGRGAGVVAEPMAGPLARAASTATTPTPA